MKTHLRIITTIFLLAIWLCGYPQVPSGQAQWAAQGGGPADNTGGTGSFDKHETSNDMVTDREGNVYIVGNVNQNPTFGDSMYIAPKYSWGGSDIFAAKYSACGQLKWVRFAGSIGADYANAVVVDDSLNVYVSGYCGPAKFPYPGGQTQLNASHQGYFLAKYDSVGVLKWVFTPQQPTFAYPMQSVSKPIQIQGNRILAYINTTSGTFATNVVVPAFGQPGYGAKTVVYFDLNGNAQKALVIDSCIGSYDNVTQITCLRFNPFDSLFYCFHIAVDTVSLLDSIISADINNVKYNIVIFDEQGHWKRSYETFKNDGLNAPYFTNIAIKDSIVFFAGNGWKNASIDGDTFIRLPSSNSLSSNWYLFLNHGGIYKSIYDTLQGQVPAALPLFNGNRIMLRVLAGRTMKMPGLTYTVKTNVVRNDLLEIKPDWTFGYLDSIKNFNYLNNDLVRAMACDEQGNIFCAGQFSYRLIAGHDTLYSTSNSYSDAFVYKWGLSCTDSCALVTPLAPTQLLADAAGPHAIRVKWLDNSKYEGRFYIYRSTDSTSNFALIDSVNQNDTAYVDAAVQPNQTYWYKVIANNCQGNSLATNADSARIIYLGLANLYDQLQHMEVYPNPATDGFTKVSVWSEKNSSGSLTVSDLDGRIFQSHTVNLAEGKNDYVLATTALANGTYILTIISSQGQLTKRVIVLR